MTTAIVPASGTRARARLPDDDSVEGDHDADPEEVAPQRVEDVPRGDGRHLRRTPRWWSTKRRIDGPSLSRKNVLKSVNEMKNAKEVSLRIPSTPRRSVEPMSGTASFTSAFAPEVPSAPASFTQLSTLSAASDGGLDLAVLDDSSHDEQEHDNGEREHGQEKPTPAPRSTRPAVPLEESTAGADDRVPRHLRPRPA